jgi:glycosyltransferase involved in cell wall biosynthesis
MEVGTVGDLGDRRGGLDIAYACGALKVTTRDDSTSTGPRAHVTGLIAGFRDLGHRVRPMLAGDRVPARLNKAGSTGAVMASRSWQGRLIDTARVGLNPVIGGWTRAGGRRCDVFYERQATYQTLGVFRPAGTPWVIESNGPFWYEASTERNSLSYPRLAKQLELLTYRRADLVVAVSEALKTVLVEAAGLDPQRVLVVPNAVDPRRFHTPVPRITSADVTVGFVGHMIGWAGLANLVDATAIARRRGAPVRLLLVGDGPGRREIEHRATAVGLSDVVEFTGHCAWTDVPRLLARCDVAFSGQVPMAIGSMYHSPLKLYEYYAAGLPVVATDFPDARQLITGAGAGWLVASNDVPALADVLVQVAQERGSLPHAGEAARRYVLAQHTWTHRANMIIAELRRRGLVRDVPDSALG